MGSAAEQEGQNGPNDREWAPGERGFLIALAVIAVGLAGVGTWLLVAGLRHNGRDGWNETYGIVSSLNGDDATISFKDSDGIRYEFEHEASADWQMASVVDVVVYPPREPDRAQLPSDPDQGRKLLEYALWPLCFAGFLGWLAGGVTWERWRHTRRLR